jgi:CHASE2 domain-containing sensor protein
LRNFQFDIKAKRFFSFHEKPDSHETAMLPIIRKLKIILKALGFAVLTWILLLILPHRPVFEPLDALLEANDIFFYKRFFKNLDPHLRAFKDLVIIDSRDPEEELNRAEYADLIRRLTLSEAACIGIDIRFIGTRDTRTDAELVEAVRQSPRAVLALSFVESTEPPTSFGRDIARKFALPEELAESFFIMPSFDNVQLPFDSLLAAAHHLGHINFLREHYHEMPLVCKYDLHVYPALPLEMARVYGEHKGLDLDITAIPTTHYSQILVNFVPKKEFEYFTLNAARERLNTEPLRFRDKIVLLVNSGPEIPFTDTPLGYAPYPRWALHASIISQIIQNRHIEASWFPPIFLAAAALLLALAWYLFISERFSESWRRLTWLILAGNSIFILLAYFALRAEIWLGVVTPALVYSISIITIRGNVGKIYQMKEYDNIAIAVTESQNGHYPASIIYSPAGEETDNVSFPKFFEQKAFAGKFEKLRQSAATLSDLRELGNKLYEAVFQQSIDTRLMQSLGMAKMDDRRLRIQFRFDAPEISQLPWEYMYTNKLPVEFMALNRDISITRYIPFAATSKLKEYRGPLKILVAIASPNGLPPLDVEAEKAAIKKSLKTLIWLQQVKITFCEHATLEKLGKAIAGSRYDVLHYIGHSAFDEEKGEGFLELEDESGERQPAEAEAVGLILHESSLRMAVLNSCEGAVSSKTNLFFGVAQKLVKVGVPAVVGMQHEIRDDVAILFAREFYYSLLAHYSVDAAVVDARRAIVNRIGLGRQDWGTPVLFMRADGAKLFRVK